MPTQYTDNLALNLPEVGASRDSWGSLLNDNFTALDATMPIGALIDFAGSAAPSGWLLCDGRAVSRSIYSDLFAVLGTSWGAGDGSTTFRLPNTPGRATVATGTVTDSNGNNVAFAFGQTAGAVLQNIQQAHLPAYNLTAAAAGTHSHGNSTGIAGAHNHTVDSQGDHSHTYISPATPGPVMFSGGPFGVAGTTTTSTDGAHIHNVSYVDNHAHGIVPDGSHTHTVPSGGGGQAVNMLSPVIVMNKIIFAGKQATVGTLAATVQQRRQATPLRGSH